MSENFRMGFDQKLETAYLIDINWLKIPELYEIYSQLLIINQEEDYQVLSAYLKSNLEGIHHQLSKLEAAEDSEELLQFYGKLGNLFETMRVNNQLMITSGLSDFQEEIF